MRRSIAALSLSGALLAGGAAGVLLGNPVISGAQATTTTPSATTPSATGSDTGIAEHGAWLTEALAPLVADGTLTQAQADAVATALQDAHPGGRGGMGGHGGGAMGGGLDAAATALGLTADELRSALASGQTLGQIADSEGVARTALVEALLSAAKEHLAEEVAEGDLTQAEADARAAELSTRITEGLDSTMPGRGMGGRMGADGGRHGMAPDAGATGGSATPSSARPAAGSASTTA